MTAEEMCTNRPTPLSRAASSAMWVPFTFTSQKREVSDGIPTSAAVWIITSQPAAARCHSPGHLMSPATTPSASSAARSTPTTSTPSRRSRSASERPMNPAAPVISTRFTRGS